MRKNFLLILLAVFGLKVHAAEPLKADVQDVGIEEKIGESIDSDFSFTDETGKTAPLRSFFGQDQPVIVSLVYYGCPSLCTLVLNGLTDGLKDLKGIPGKDFRVITVSIDPSEKKDLALEKKRAYTDRLGKGFPDDGWVFLTGSEKEIGRLAAQLGFNYFYDAPSGEYIHAAGIYFIDPSGVIKRVLHGSRYAPQELYLALKEASPSVGFFDKLFLCLYQYDASTKTYRLNLVLLGIVTFGIPLLIVAAYLSRGKLGLKGSKN